MRSRVDIDELRVVQRSYVEDEGKLRFRCSGQLTCERRSALICNGKWARYPLVCICVREVDVGEPAMSST